MIRRSSSPYWLMDRVRYGEAYLHEVLDLRESQQVHGLSKSEIRCYRDSVNFAESIRHDRTDEHTYRKEDGAYGRGQLRRTSASLAERGVLLGCYVPRRGP